jgi:chemotaxis protein CheD
MPISSTLSSVKSALETPKQRLCIAGVGDWVVSAEPDITLATYALGSCIGLIAYDPQARVGGLLHFMLPDSALNPEKARRQPGAFFDTGMECLLADLDGLGASRRRLRFFMAGAAKVLSQGDFFDIGRRNHLAAKRKLWEIGHSVEDEDCGGGSSRTFKIRLGDGLVTVRDSFGERELRHRPLRRV